MSSTKMGLIALLALTTNFISANNCKDPEWHNTNGPCIAKDAGCRDKEWHNTNGPCNHKQRVILRKTNLKNS